MSACIEIQRCWPHACGRIKGEKRHGKNRCFYRLEKSPTIMFEYIYICACTAFGVAQLQQKQGNTCAQRAR